MNITLYQTLIIILVSVTVLLVILYLVFRSTKTVYPVRCVHCWTHKNKETIISYSETPEQWGICPECIRVYWRFGNQGSTPVKND